MNEKLQETKNSDTYLLNLIISNIMNKDNLLNNIVNKKWKLNPNTKLEKLIDNIMKTLNNSKNYWDYIFIINNIMEKINENKNNHILTMQFWHNQRKKLKLNQKSH